VQVKQPYSSDHAEQLKVLQDFVMDLSFIVNKGRLATERAMLASRPPQ